MQKFLNYIQPQIIRYELSVIEGMVLDYIMRAFSWANKLEIDGIEYVKLHPQKIMDDLPVMGITTKVGLNKHINKLINMGLIEKKIKGNAPYYAITEYTRNYEMAGGKQMLSQGQTNVYTSINDCLHYSNINSNIKYITIPIDQVKNKNIGLAKKVEDLLFFLRGEETDLKDVSHKKIIELWNSYHNEYKLPRVNLDNPNSVMVQSIKRAWDDFKIRHTKEEFNTGLQNYLKDIKGRKITGQVNGYEHHRFSLYIFLTQRNGIYKFMSIG